MPEGETLPDTLYEALKMIAGLKFIYNREMHVKMIICSTARKNVLILHIIHVGIEMELLACQHRKTKILFLQKYYRFSYLIRTSKAIHVFQNSDSYAITWCATSKRWCITSPVDSNDDSIWWNVSFFQIRIRNLRLGLVWV